MLEIYKLWSGILLTNLKIYNLPGYFKSFNKGKIYILSVWVIFKNCIFFVNEDLDKGQQPSRIAVTKDDISQIENICSITIILYC